MKPLHEQVNAARRELAMRRNVYPKWIATGRMRQAAADHEIECMEAIVATLEKCLLLAEVGDQMQDRASTQPRLT